MTLLTTIAVLYKSKAVSNSASSPGKTISLTARRKICDNNDNSKSKALQNRNNKKSTVIEKTISQKSISKMNDNINNNDNNDNNIDKNNIPTSEDNDDSNDNNNNSDMEKLFIDTNETVFTAIILVVVYVFYFCIFHSLANLPLGDKLLYGIHQRFWMQPNVLLFCFAGVGFNYCMYATSYIIYLVYNFLNPKQQMEQMKNMNRSVDDIIKSFDEDKDELKKSQLSLPSLQSPSSSSSSFSSSSSSFYLVRSIIGIIISLYITLHQHDKWYFASDQSDAYAFKRYSSAILDPLPSGAMLLVNYDMLWTSIRYIQECEGYRKDITSINLLSRKCCKNVMQEI